MGLLVALALFLAMTTAVSVFGYIHYVKPSRLLDQLATSTSDALPTRNGSPKDDRITLSKILGQLGTLIPVSPQDAAMAKVELTAAGFRTSSAAGIYFGCKIAMAAICLFCATMARGAATAPVMRIVVPVAGAAAGWALPGFALARMVKKRRERLRLSLPDVLDLMVVCTEAGCGLDQAILNVSRDLKFVHPDISEELALVNMEIMAGKSRADSLRNLGRRTDEDEIKKLCAILVQTDRFGTSVSEALRTQSDFLRVRRRQEAEERAGKVGVKLVFPIFFFCLPSLLIVTAGPGMLQLFTNLFPAMQSMGH